MTNTTRRHRDGTLTVWNVYTQTWDRRSAVAIYRDAELMSSIGAQDRALVEAVAFHGSLTDARRVAATIRRLADQGGTIQAEQMLQLTSEPTLHTTMTIDMADRALRTTYVAAALHGQE